jgi:hypothetical protein
MKCECVHPPTSEISTEQLEGLRKYASYHDLELMDACSKLLKTLVAPMPFSILYDDREVIGRGRENGDGSVIVEWTHGEKEEFSSFFEYTEKYGNSNGGNSVSVTIRWENEYENIIIHDV